MPAANDGRDEMVTHHLGLHFRQNPALNATVNAYASQLGQMLDCKVKVGAREVVRGHETYAIVEVVAQRPPCDETWLQIEFWNDGLIAVGNHIFKTPEELGITFTTASIPVTDNEEHGSLASLLDWLHGLDISDSLHKFVNAEVLLQELNTAIGA